MKKTLILLFVAVLLMFTSCTAASKTQNETTNVVNTTQSVTTTTAITTAASTSEETTTVSISEIGLSMLKNKFGETDPKTDNEYSWLYEGTESINNVEYLNYRMSWIVNGRNSYLYNVFVDVENEKFYMAQSTDNGWTIEEI